MTVVLVGMHGAGKSTIGRALAARLGVPFHGEIGHELAQRTRPPRRTAADPQLAFDRAVFEAELARDAAWSPRAPRVVETWHPGNLAYAARRSPGLARVLFGCARASAALHPCVVVPVHIPRDLARARQHERGDLAFFEAVGTEAEGWAVELGLPLLPPVHNTGAVDDAVDAILARLPPTLPLERS